MSHRPRTRIILLLFISIFCGTAEGAESLAETANQTKVTLFGQPCLLQGPFGTATLKAIHEISPERISTSLSLLENLNGQTFKTALGKLNSAAKLPAAFDRYRDRTTRRLEALIAFSEGLRGSLKYRKSSMLIEKIQPHLPPKNLKIFAALAKKIDEKKSDPSQLSRKLADAYNDLIEPDPEEEFHRATQKLGLKYNCAFEESSAEEDSE